MSNFFVNPREHVKVYFESMESTFYRVKVHALCWFIPTSCHLVNTITSKNSANIKISFQELEF